MLLMRSSPATKGRNKRATGLRKQEPRSGWLRKKQRLGIQLKKERGGIVKTEKRLGSFVSELRLFVKSAVARFILLTLRERSSANRVVEITREDVSKESPLVFDLSVEPHRCYLANGVLVSNSDAFQNLAVGLRKAIGMDVPDSPDTEDAVAFGGMEEESGPRAPAYELDADIF